MIGDVLLIFDPGGDKLAHKRIVLDHDVADEPQVGASGFPPTSEPNGGVLCACAAIDCWQPMVKPVVLARSTRPIITVVSFIHTPPWRALTGIAAH